MLVAVEWLRCGMTTLFLGVDPGLHGGFAALHGPDIVELADLPTIQVSKSGKSRREYLPSELSQLVRRTLALMPASTDVLAVIERQQAMPRQGATSGFRLGLGTGLIVGVLAALHVPYVWIESRHWKKGVGLLKGSDKGASIELASRLFPSVDLERKDGRADALLMAEYARRVLQPARAA